MKRFAIILLVAVGLTACASPEDAPAPRIFFASPADGSTVTNPITVEMAAEGIDVKPAGVMEENSGHFHILVNQPFVAAGSVVPSDSVHLHFGTAATSTELTLEPGDYVLRLQLGDGAHIAMEGFQDEIRVTVQ